MGALPFIIRAKRAGVWARTKDYSRGEIGIDGLEMLDVLGDNEEEYGGRGREKIKKKIEIDILKKKKKIERLEREWRRERRRKEKVKRKRLRKRKKHRKTLKREGKEYISLRNNCLDLSLENNKIACMLRYLYVSLQKKGH